MTAILPAERPEQDVARYIDTYKYDNDITERRTKFGGGTSLPLDSDGYEDRQRKLKQELRNDFLVQQEKVPQRPMKNDPYAPKHSQLSYGPQNPADYDMEIQKMTDRYHSHYNGALFEADNEPGTDPVYYRVGTPELGLRGLGQYEQQRQELNAVRQREYNAILREKRNLELQRVQARRNQPPPPSHQPPGAQVDYDEQNQRARLEDKRAYQDHMGKFHHQPTVATVKPPINYEDERKRLSEELKQDYAQYQEKKAQDERYWRMRGKPVTPPGGLDIGLYDKHLKEHAPQKKKEYKEKLDQQRYAKLRSNAWERVAEVSPNHMHYRDEERPLVGSPRDVNFHMHEKEEKDKFGLIKQRLKPHVAQDKTTSTYQHEVARKLAKRDEENFTRYLEAEKEKRENQKKYREDLLKQQKEHMLMRARQEPEMPVLDRSVQQQANYVSSKPPPGPQQAQYVHREELPNRQTPNYWNDGKRERSPVSQLSEGSKQTGKDGDIPSAFRTKAYNPSQDTDYMSYRERGPHNDNRGMNGYDRQQPPALPRSPQKSRRTPPPPLELEQQYDHDYQDRRHQPNTQEAQQAMNGDPRGEQRRYMELYQGQGQRSQERSRQMSRQTPPAFQTQANGGGYKPSEGTGRTPPRESRRSENRDKQENPAIGGIYVFDDSRQDNVKRQIYEMKKNDYNEYLKKKNDEQRMRQEEVRQHRNAPAPVMKDHHYSSDEYVKYKKSLQQQDNDDYRQYLQKEYQPKWKIGLPLGQYKYEPKRLLMEHERNREYNELVTKQFQPPKNAQGLPLGQYVYEPKRLAMEAERNREYNAMQTKPKQPPRVDGPQGLNIDVSYHERKKVLLEKQRNKDYNELLKKEEEHNRYDNGHFEERHDKNYDANHSQPYTFESGDPENSIKDRRDGTPQRQYRSTNQQTSSNMQSVLNHIPSGTPINQRTNSRQKIPTPNTYEGSYVPAPPDHYGTNPHRFHDQMTAPYPKASSVPADYSNIPATPNKLSLPVGSYDETRRFMDKERNREYNNYLSKLPEIRSNRSGAVGGGMTPQATSLTLPVGSYDALRPVFEKQRNEEYNHLKREGRLDKGIMRHKASTPPNQQGLFDSQVKYEDRVKYMEKQRNREYNEFLNKKYAKGKMTSRSEPDRFRDPPYIGHDDEQEMKKRYLAEERSRQYNQMISEQEPPRSRSVNITTDADSGLPIGQHHHEAYRRFQREQRNREYNQMIHTKNQEVRNRDWKFGTGVVLELKGDDEQKFKKQQLREEAQKDLNEYMSQTKKKSNRTWPDGKGGLLVQRGDYDNMRNMYSNERKQDLRQYLNEQDTQQSPRGDERRSRSEPAPAGVHDPVNPIVNALGKYHDKRKQLVDDRRQEFKSFMAEKKLHEILPKRGQLESAPTKAGDEKPLVNKMGLYEVETRKKFTLERKKDFVDFSKKKEKEWTPRNNVKENMMPHDASAETPLVNLMGHYDNEKGKFRVERNKDLREFSYKKKQEYHSPHNNYVYPTVAVAEKPLVEYMGRDVDQRKLDLRQERRHDYERYQSQQRVKDAPRRHDYLDHRSTGPYEGIFSGLGDHGNTKETLGQQRRQEYNDHLDQYPHPKATGRPTWVKEQLPNSKEGTRSPMRNPNPVDHYQQILDEKRREEVQRRRLDDHDYQGRNLRDDRYMSDMQPRNDYYPGE